MSIRPTESGGRIAYAQTPWGDYCVVWDADGNLVSQVVAIKEPGGTEPSRGLGDTIAKLTDKLGIPKCVGCTKRQPWLNKLVPYKNRPKEQPHGN